MSLTGDKDETPSPPLSRFYKPPSVPRPPHPDRRSWGSSMTLEDLVEIRAMSATPKSSPDLAEGLRALSGIMSEHYAGMERGPGGASGTPPSKAWEAREGERRERENDRDGDVPALSLDEQKAPDDAESEDEGRAAQHFEHLVRARPTNWSDRKHAPVLKAIWDAYMTEGEAERSGLERIDEVYDRVEKGMPVLFPELEQGTVRWNPHRMGEMLKRCLREDEGRKKVRAKLEEGRCE